MKFWKEHMGLRALLIGGFFFAGLALVIYGWTLTGKMSGLGLMVLGVVFLLTALMVYCTQLQEEYPGNVFVEEAD